MAAHLATHPKKRLEILVEAPILPRLREVIEREGATGYTVFPAIAGSGRGGDWSVEGTVSDADRMVAVVCLTDAARVPALLDAVFGLVSRQIGLVALSDVEVVRAERF